MPDQDVTSNAEPPQTRIPPSLESSPGPIPLRVKVHHAVMRSPPSAASSRASTEPPHSDLPPSHRSLQQPRRGSAQAQTSSARSKILVIGPGPDQILEVSDSSSGDSHDTGFSSSPMNSSAVPIYRSVSTSHLPDFSSTRDTLDSSFGNLRAVKSQEDLSVRHETEEEGVDWVEYSANDPDLDGYAADAVSSESYDDRGTRLLFGRSKRGPNKTVDHKAVSRMLHDWLNTKPPSQTEPHRLSKRPMLGINVSAPNSPTTGIRAAQNRRARAVSASADIRADKSSAASSIASDANAGHYCEACGSHKSVGKWMRLDPCNHVICSTCFGASISAVSTSRSVTRCPSCLQPMMSCYPADELHLRPLPPPKFPRVDQVIHVPEPGGMRYPVLRIDNVAWDITPEIVREYLPPDVLPHDHPQPIHILMDRLDGRTKDFMYIEVANEASVRQILKLRQNSHMPGGPLTCGRKRPVTITSVPLDELINELRPLSAAELFGLLALCQAAVTCPQLAYPAHPAMTSLVAPTGLAHFVKSRHGPFFNVMSILTKLRGRESPAYWDVFCAIQALGRASAHIPLDARTPYHDLAIKRQDEQVLHQLLGLFNATFRTFD